MNWLTRLQYRPLDASALLVLALAAQDEDQRLAAQEEMPTGQRDHKAWMDARVDATRRIEDERFLKRLAIYGPTRVRWAAINNPRLTDQEFLARLVDEDPDSANGIEALDKIDKPDVVRRLAGNPHHSWQVTNRLASKMLDHDMVDDMAKALQDPVPKVRQLAADALKRIDPEAAAKAGER